MGQCSLTDPEKGCTDVFSNSRGSEEATRESYPERDRLLWDNQLAINIPTSHKLPEPKYWHEIITKIHPCFSQISKDVTRTFPQLPYFANRSNIHRFQKILKKIALYFPHLGYTQGMNFTVGFFMLSGCEDEECFRLMVKLLLHDKILAIGLYEDNFPLVTFYCEMFWILLEKKLPAVFRILKKSYITDDLWLFQWFISVFLYNFPLEFVRRIWNFLVCKKEMALVLIALGIVKSIKNQLISYEFQDEMEFLDFVNQFKDVEYVRENLNLDKILKFANSISKADIEKAIAQTKCLDNPYRVYFFSSSSEQKEQWEALMRKLEVEREDFTQNRKMIKCEREEVFEKVEKLILSKYKLYQSALKMSDSNRRSNISARLSMHTVRSSFLKGADLDFNKNHNRRF